MQTAIKHVKAPITRSPSDGSGTFEAVIYAFQRDLDGERFENFVNVPGRFPLNYAHVNFAPGAAEGVMEDPGARVGTVMVTHDKRLNALRLQGQLDLESPMGQAVYERMLMDPGERLALSEFSVGFTIDPAKAYKDSDGTRVLVDASLVEVSVVYAGAQKTELLSVKSARDRVFPHRDENGERFMVAASGKWCMYASGKVLRIPQPDDDLRDALDALEGDAKSAPSGHVSADVAALIRDVHAERVREDQERAAFQAQQESLLLGPIPGIEDDRARDAERFEREERERARRDAEREREAAQADLADAARRDRDWNVTPGGTAWYVADESIEQPKYGETFRLPVGGVQ